MLLGRWLFACVTVLSVSLASAQVPSNPGDWPQWRGPARDGVSRETGLLKEWPEAGPPVVWQVDTCGLGYSTIAVKDGRIYTQGDLDGIEHVICLNARDGSLLWKVQPRAAKDALEKRIADELRNDPQKNADELRREYGGLRDGTGDGPRGTPTVDGDRVYSEGGLGDVTCLDAKTGDEIWHVHLEHDLGGSRPGWGYCESPLVEGSFLIVTPGGDKGTVAALDKYTGKLVWQSQGVTEGAQYSSPVAADLAGQRQIIQFGANSVFGVTAAKGVPLWNYARPANGTANCCTPIALDDHVFGSSAYGTGGGLARIVRSGNRYEAEEVYFEKKMANHHGGIVLLGDHLYGFGDGSLICLEFLTGKLAWQNRSVGKGSLVAADGMLYCLGEGHRIALVEATPLGYREHGRFKIEDVGRPSWAHPVVAGGRLYIRNQDHLTAYNVQID